VGYDEASHLKLPRPCGSARSPGHLEVEAGGALQASGLRGKREEHSREDCESTEGRKVSYLFRNLA